MAEKMILTNQDLAHIHQTHKLLQPTAEPCMHASVNDCSWPQPRFGYQTEPILKTTSRGRLK